MHLLYSRFFKKALRDLGYVDFDEPYSRLMNQGMLIKDHKKISKRSNPLTPDPVVAKHGADTIRCYLMFLGPWDQGGIGRIPELTVFDAGWAECGVWLNEMNHFEGV
ncbi:MAG: hypothetical protein Ct9H300mP19_12720 [Dehalococcoidia bacterium]|nr:MAG: hypothetical protein Ct9H300mP19_12720 [Dehalococcoidia bacterium]